MKKIDPKKFFPGFYVFLTILMLSSCTTTPVSQVPSAPGPTSSLTIHHDAGTYARNTTAGVHHLVAPGETLWRIAKMYDVDPESIRTANRIADPTDIEIGRRLYVPNANMRRNVLTLYPNDKWDYIIIHHSATDFGSSTEFNRTHTERGWQGVGYHFIIDNGTYETDDGQIESTPRWINQTDGAHCRASGMNSKGIGICLVGNFSKSAVTAKQMESLVFLVSQLKSFYNIPESNIMGHGQVPGAKTECPGKKFPWNKFWRNLRRT